MKRKKILNYFAIVSLFVFFITSQVFAELPILDESYFTNLDKTQPQEEVYMLQTLLNELGYTVEEDKGGETVPPNGIYGAKTVAAVKEFQKENELQITGEINTETIKTLNDLSIFINENQNWEDEDNTVMRETDKITIWERVYNFYLGIWNALFGWI